MRWLSIIVLAITLSMLTIVTSGISPAANMASVASATDLSDYTYVKTGTIDGSLDGILNDYQVRLVVNRFGSGDDCGNLTLEGHSLSWPNDIRFADRNGNICPYWIEYYDIGTAVLWVKIKKIPAYPDNAGISIYYGKEGDVSGSDGPATFLMFDGLSDDTRRGTIWREDHINGFYGYTDVHRFESSGYHIKQTIESDRNTEIELATPFDLPVWCGVTLDVISETGRRSPPWTRAGVNYSTNIWGYGYWGEVCTGYDVLPGHTYEISWTNGKNNDNLLLYENGGLLSNFDVKFTGDAPGFGVRTASDAMGEWYFRNFYARAYTPNPPVSGEWSSERSVNSVEGWPGILTIICCGGCICGTIVILLLIILVLAIHILRKK
jgi:hypothetical protein